jgi:ankyrin repeat protein
MICQFFRKLVLTVTVTLSASSYSYAAMPEYCQNSKSDLDSWVALVKRQLENHDPRNARKLSVISSDIIYGDEHQFRKDIVGVDPNTPLKTLAGDMSFLELAASACHIGIAKALVEAGASPNGNGDSTPLVAAAAKDDVEMIKYLIEHGARIEKTDRNGMAALEMAVRARSANSTKMLLSLGAYPNNKLAGGGTLLDLVGHSSEPADRALAEELKRGGGVFGQISIQPKQ